MQDMALRSFFLFASVAAPLLAAPFAPLLARAFGARAGWLLALAFVPGLFLVREVWWAIAQQPATLNIAWVSVLGLDITLAADGFSLMFALVVAVIGLLVMSYAASYLAENERHGRFYSYLLLFGGAMMGLVLADNLLALLVFWELTSITSFLLIGFWDDRKASQDGAVKALLVTALGGLALLVGVALLILAGGNTRISELEVETLRQSPLFAPALAMILLAAFTKSAQVPFHVWLPTAMEAPTPVSAYLHSATMVKAGLVLVAKFAVLLSGTVFADITLYVGLITLCWGSYLALRQSDLKALLAYSTISQLGLMISLYGAGHGFAATAHLVNHAAFKAALFLVVGVIDHETGSRDLTRLGGLRRALPITFALALPAALSMGGLPPLGGFISKEGFYQGMLAEGALPITLAVLGSVMTLAYSLKFLSVFVGPTRLERPHVHEAPAAFWSPILPLSFATILFGLLPITAQAFTILASASLGFEVETLSLWPGPTLPLGLSVLTWLLGGLLFAVREPFNAVQRALALRVNPDTLYYALLRGLEQLAQTLTTLTQGATLAVHLRLLLIPVAGAGVLLGFRAFPTELTPVPLEFWAVTALVLTGSLGVLFARSRLGALIFMGVAGLSSVLAFVALRAPDLALTQLLIETVSVILFLSVFRYLPRLTRYGRRPLAVGFDALLSGAIGATVFAALVAVQTPLGTRLKDFFLSYSKTGDGVISGGGGNNVVNVILVDFRGYDTMGEITVLAITGITVYALLKLRTRAPEDASKKAGEGREQTP